MRHLLILIFFTTSALAAPPALRDGDRIDAVGSAAAVIDLSDAAAAALEGNPRLAQERAGISELRARIWQARATAFPRIDLQGSFSRGRDPSFALDEFFSGGGDSTSGFVLEPEQIPAQSFWRSSIDGSWELRPLKVNYALNAAKSALHEQEFVVQDEEHRTLEAVVAAYHRVVLEQETLAALQAEIDAKREHLATTRRRFRLDLAAPLDTLQAAVSLANLEPTRRRQERAVRAAGENLNLLMGRDPLTPLAIRAELAVETEQIDRDRALALAVEHPQLRGAESATDFLRGRRKVQRSDNMPYLTLEGSYGYVGKSVDSMFEEGQDVWRTAITLKIPIWDGFATKGLVKETEAAIRRSEFSESEVQRSVRAEVLAAQDELETARTNLTAAELNLTLAEEARRLTARRYELGKAGYLDVLNADAERFTAHGNLVQARFDVQVATAKLKRAIGRSPLTPLAAILSESREVAP